MNWNFPPSLISLLINRYCIPSNWSAIKEEESGERLIRIYLAGVEGKGKGARLPIFIPRRHKFSLIKGAIQCTLEREREAASLLRVSNTGEVPFSRKTFLFRRAQNARDSTRFELAGARRSTTRLSLALFNNYSQGCRCVETLCARVYACIDIYTLWSGKTSRDKWNRCLGREGC